MTTDERENGTTWRSRPMLILYTVATVFTITQIGSGITGAIVPLYLLSLGVSLTTIGLLYSILNLLSGLIRTPVGIVSDTTGPRRFIFAGLLTSIAGITCMALAWDWKLAAASMVLTGLASGIFFPMMKRTAADETGVRERIKAFTTIGLIFSLTGIVGPAIAGLIVEAYNLRYVFYVALAISLLGTLIYHRMMPFTLPEKRMQRIELNEILGSALSLERGAVLLGVTNFLRTMTWGISMALVPIFLQEKFNLTYGELGFYMSVSTATALIGAPIASRFTTSRRRTQFIVYAQPALLPLYVFLTLVGRPEAAVITLSIINFLGSMTGPMIDTLISDVAPPGKIGTAYGVIDTFLRVGISVGNIVGGYTAEHFGLDIVFILSGLVASSTALPMLILRRTQTIWET